MKTYVINLARSTDRRAHMTRQLDALGMAREFVEAVEGRSLNSDERAQLVDEDAVARYPHWLTPGAIGCVLSHRRAYQQILEEPGDVGLVVEDDVLLPPDLPAVLDQLHDEMRGAEVVLLYHRSHGPMVVSSADAVDLMNGSRLLYPMDVRQPTSAAAYLITRAACERMVDAMVPVHAACDKWESFYEHGCFDSIRCVVPWLVTMRNDFKSTIDYVDPTSRRARLSAAITSRKIFPLHQALTWRRTKIERSLSRVEIVSQTSPLARSSAIP
jgi:glycosyl transferase, family 25